MTVRCGNQTIMHNDTEDAPAPQDTTPLGNTPQNHRMAKQGS